MRSAAGRTARATNGSESAETRTRQAALAEGPAAIAGLLQRLREKRACAPAQRLAGETPALRTQPSNLCLASPASSASAGVPAGKGWGAAACTAGRWPANP